MEYRKFTDKADLKNGKLVRQNKQKAIPKEDLSTASSTIIQCKLGTIIKTWDSLVNSAFWTGLE